MSDYNHHNPNQRYNHNPTYSHAPAKILGQQGPSPHTNTNTGITTNTTQSTNKIGPRAKCDQVVYEAIAKAAEIIVRGRCCDIPQQQTSSNGSHGSGGSSSGGSGGGAGARFNLEMEEVEMVRSILQMWKKQLHVPLRLDLYYQYCTDPNQPEQTTRKELLERWCIDYHCLSQQQQQQNQYHSNSSHSQHPSSQQKQYHMNNSTSGNNGTTTTSSDETIVQLRLVCKHVVIFLRTLYSLTRIMPAYRLHHALQVEQEDRALHQQQQQRQQYHQQQHHNQQYGMGGGGGGYYSNNTNQPSTAPPPTWTNDESLVGGKILFSFYVSEHGGAAEADARLLSSNSNTPFTRNDLNPIPTPYGLLHLTALYDSTLNVERVLMDRAQRLVQCRNNIMMAGNMGNGVSNNYGMSMAGWTPSQSQTQAIPINPHQQQQQQMPHQEQSRPQNSPHYQQNLQQRSTQEQQNPMSIQHTPPTNSYPSQPMSAPQQHNIIQDYANRGKAGSQQQQLSASPHQILIADQKKMNAISGNGHLGGGEHDNMRDRLSSDPGYIPARSLGQTKRGPSGLSLALMNSDHDENHQQQQLEQPIQSQDETDAHGGRHSTSPHPPSPIIPQSKSGDEAASLRQRLAFHHPPPSFNGDSAGVAGGSTLAPSVTIGGSTGQQHKYGYGYNNGGKIMTMATSTGANLNGEVSPQLSSSPGTTAHLMGVRSSPIPILNTPPQPVFLGSLPSSRRGSGASYSTNTRISPTDMTDGMSTHNQTGNCESEKGGILTPPFRNPIALQQVPSLGGGGGSGGGDTVLNSTVVGFNQSRLQQAGNDLNAAIEAIDDGNAQVGTTNTAMDKDVLLPPLTSLDMLANSPFKGPGVGGAANHTANGSVVSSLSVGMGSAAYGLPPDDLQMNNMAIGFGSLLPSSRSGLPGSIGGDFLNKSGGLGGAVVDTQSYNQNQESSAFEDMPFAVDMDTPTGSGTFLSSTLVGEGSPGNQNSKMLARYNSSSVETGMGSSTGTASSQIVTSLAHRCATGRRLKLFKNEASEVKNNQGGKAREEPSPEENSDDKGIKSTNRGTDMQPLDMSTNMLAMQLAEFHTFESSLVTSGVTTSSTKGTQFVES